MRTDFIQPRGPQGAQGAQGAEGAEGVRGRRGRNIDTAVSCAGLTLQPGHYVYADEDGVVVSAQPLL